MLQQVNKFARYLLDWNSMETEKQELEVRMKRWRWPTESWPQKCMWLTMRVRLARHSLGEDCVLP